MENTSNDQPVPFGYRIGWLAIRSTDVAAVASSLQLIEPHPTTWDKGLHAAYETDSYVFVTPEVNGWILVVGRWLLRETLGPLVTRLSAEFGEARAFATYRVVDYHHWILARNGVLQRAFAFVGDRGIVFFNIGQLTTAEQSFAWDSLALYEWLPNEANVVKPAEPSPASDSSSELDWSPGEEDVMTVAEQWSINPCTLSEETPFTGVGVIGRIP